MTTAQAISIILGSTPGDIRKAALKLYEHCAETDMLYADLLQWLTANSNAIERMPPEMFARIEKFNARMKRENGL